jgi:RNA polymerase sigma-70 factor, ECF subfamily
VGGGLTVPAPPAGPASREEPRDRSAAAGDREERRLLALLRAGDEDAFRALVERYHTTMVRVAMGFVPSRAVAEEVAQEAWLGVVRGIHSFEGRAAFRTWLMRIVVNRARTRGVRERRSVPFSALVDSETTGAEAAVDPDRFLPAEDRWGGGWARPPRLFGDPHALVAERETRAAIGRAIDRLSPAQRAVIMLRDVQGAPASEVCSLLDISEVNQRVLLHRARSRVRAELERHLEAADGA